MVAPYTADEVKATFATAIPESLDVFDYPAADAGAAQLENVTTPPSSELAAELDGAAEWLGVTVEEILLAALGRTLGRTRGDGAVAVDVACDRQGLCHPVSLICAAGAPMGPTELLQGAHNALAAAPERACGESQLALRVLNTDAGQGGSGYALELRVTRMDGSLRADWVYNAGRLDAYSVEEMAEQFSLALIEITSDAGAPL